MTAKRFPFLPVSRLCAALLLVCLSGAPAFSGAPEGTAAATNATAKGAAPLTINLHELFEENHKDPYGYYAYPQTYVEDPDWFNPKFIARYGRWFTDEEKKQIVPLLMQEARKGNALAMIYLAFHEARSEKGQAWLQWASAFSNNAWAYWQFCQLTGENFNWYVNSKSTQIDRNDPLVLFERNKSQFELLGPVAEAGFPEAMALWAWQLGRTENGDYTDGAAQYLYLSLEASKRGSDAAWFHLTGSFKVGIPRLIEPNLFLSDVASRLDYYNALRTRKPLRIASAQSGIKNLSGREKEADEEARLLMDKILQRQRTQALELRAKNAPRLPELDAFIDSITETRQAP